MAKILHEREKVRRPRAARLRLVGYLAALAGLLTIASLWVFGRFVFNENFHAVVPDEVYRSAQPSPASLEDRIKKLGLRSVINLLTDEVNRPQFEGERRVTETNRVELHFVNLDVFMPPRSNFRRLVHLIDTAKRPLLIHCKLGVDRSGIASAVAVLLAGGNVAEARKQFGLTYGFVSLWSLSDLPKVLDDYEHWLTTRGWSHCPDRFKQWVETDYFPYFYRARLEPLEAPTSIARGSPAILRFRATNMSREPWRFSSERHRGVHFGAKMRPFNPSLGQEIELRGGFRDLTVAPGEAVTLELEIPPLSEAGCYQVLVDLVDEGKKWFSDMGSDSVIFEVRIEDSNPPTRK